MGMNWFYEENGRQSGPVSRAELAEMIRSGKLPSSALVWCQTFPDWKPVHEVAELMAGVGSQEALSAPPPIPSDSSFGTRPCSVCGAVQSEGELVRICDQEVCAKCKPGLLQRMREGLSPVAGPVFGGFWLRGGAKIIDTLIEGVVSHVISAITGLLLFGTAGVAFSQPDGMDDTTYYSFLAGSFVFNSLLGAACLAWMIQRWGATPGKFACGLRAVGADGSKVRFWRAFGRYFAEILSALPCLIGYIMSVWDSEKRTLHDRMCGTRVVVKG